MSSATRRPRRDAIANRERLLEAAVAAVKREGLKVPMATIAEDASVGIGTLYRHFPDRETLLAALTERSFRIVLENVTAASAGARTAREAVGAFVDATIRTRAEFVLPLHGGPTALGKGARELQAEVHRAVGELLVRGRDDGSIRAEVTTGDVVMFAAMLAEPLAHVDDWDAVAHRQAEIFLAGLA